MREPRLEGERERELREKVREMRKLGENVREREKPLT